MSHLPLGDATVWIAGKIVKRTSSLGHSIDTSVVAPLDRWMIQKSDLICEEEGDEKVPIRARFNAVSGLGGLARGSLTGSPPLRDRKEPWPLAPKYFGFKMRHCRGSEKKKLTR